MDDVETGYYLQLDSYSEMYRKHSSNNKQQLLLDGNNELKPVNSDGPKHSSVNGDDVEDEDEFLNDIYNLDSSKTKVYKEFYKLYSEEDGAAEDTEERESTFFSKLVLWLMILVLTSNPILGGFNLYHFNNNEDKNALIVESFNSLSGLHTDANSVLTDGYNKLDGETNPSNNQNADEVLKELATGGTGVEFTSGAKKTGTDPEAVLRNVTTIVNKYCFYEIFGEIIFGAFSLLLISLCKLPCNNSNSLRMMLPTLFMFYMIIYRLLATYVLLTSLKIFFYCLLTLRYSLITKLPHLVTYLLSFRSLDPYDYGNVLVLRKLLEHDSLGVQVLLVFTVENVYITISECLELWSFLCKMVISVFKKKILKNSEFTFYDNDASGSFRLFKSFHRDTFASSDPHEHYIHSLYNYASDIGTYLKNIDILDYKQGLDYLNNRFNSMINGDPHHSQSSFNPLNSFSGGVSGPPVGATRAYDPAFPASDPGSNVEMAKPPSGEQPNEVTNEVPN